MPPFNAASWRTLISSVASDAKFANPATESQLIAVEHSLGISLPQKIRELLLEFDGVTADYSSGLVWSAEDIQKRNQEFRSLKDFRELYMPFDHLLFFGDDGGGDQFAFAIHADGSIHKDDIFRWEHESDARSWFAGSFERHFQTRFK